MEDIKIDFDISVVIPVYNGSKSLPELTAQIDKALKKLSLSYEIIYVNDSSLDNSLEVLRDLKKTYPTIRIIDLMKNVGQQRAVLCGLSNVSGRYIVTMDDDMQQSPEDIKALYDELINDESMDVIIAKFSNKKHSGVRNFGTTLVKNFISKQLGIPSTLHMTSFRIIRRSVVEEVKKIKMSNPVIGFLIFFVTSKVKNVQCTHYVRKYSKSSYSFMNLLKYFMVMANDYIYFPLTALIWGGLIIMCITLLSSLFFFVKYLAGSPVPGFTSMIILMFMSFGVLSLSLGIIGKYLTLVLNNVNNKPLYSIRSNE